MARISLTAGALVSQSHRNDVYVTSISSVVRFVIRSHTSVWRPRARVYGSGMPFRRLVSGLCHVLASRGEPWRAARDWAVLEEMQRAVLCERPFDVVVAVPHLLALEHQFVQGPELVLV